MKARKSVRREIMHICKSDTLVLPGASSVLAVTMVTTTYDHNRGATSEVNSSLGAAIVSFASDWG